MSRLYEHLRNGTILTLVGGVMFIIGAFRSTGYMGGGDTFAHFLISKYAFKHPELFFNHWGKPVFTMLSAPFAQFGLDGLVLFNLLCGLCTLLLLLWHAKSKSISTLGVFALSLTPYFVALHVSGLTEPLFALLLLSSVVMLNEERFFWGSLLTGSLLLVRTEGILFIGMSAIFFILVRRYTSILLLFVPLVVVSVIGGFLKQGNFLWFFTELPYGVQSAYSAGSVWHFVRKSDLIFGYPLLFIGVWGMVIVLSTGTYRTLSKLTLVGYPVVYFVFHSVLYGFGLGASAGLTRVMLAIMPLLAINTGIGLNDLFIRVGKKKEVLSGFFMVAVFVGYLTSNRMPVYETPDQRLLKQVNRELTTVDEGAFYYFHPGFAAFTECDPFEGGRCFSGYPDAAATGDYLVWDNHFGPQEGATKLENVLQDETWKKVKEYKEKDDVIIVFQKVKVE